MNCHEARQHWNLYHDSEGGDELQFQISEHLAVCPECAEWFSQQSRLEGMLAERLGSRNPTPELWNQVLSRSGIVKPSPVRRRAASVAVCAVVLTVAAFWAWNRPPSSAMPDLAKLTATRHQQLAMGNEVPQFQSRSDLEVENYLRQRVSFPVRCPPRKDAGFAVQGAGVCTLADQPTAYLSGLVDESPVSIFILSRESLATFPHQRKAIAQSKTHRCREGPYAMVLRAIDRNVVMVIGQTAPERLEKVLYAYGTYPEHR